MSSICSCVFCLAVAYVIEDGVLLALTMIGELTIYSIACLLLNLAFSSFAVGYVAVMIVLACW